MNLVQKVFGTHSERELKLINPIVDKIEALRPKMIALTDEELRDNTRLFKERLAAGETLDDILPEAYATVREAARRVLDPCTVNRRHRSPSGTYCRDENR
jgi:preprotein translocase subunit SecA